MSDRDEYDPLEDPVNRWAETTSAPRSTAPTRPPTTRTDLTLSEQHIHGRECETHCDVNPDYPNMKRYCSEPHPDETFVGPEANPADRTTVRCGRMPGHPGEHDGYGPGMARIRW